MECAFDLKTIFPCEIIKVRSDLLPENFKGDPEEYRDVREKVAWIIDQIGILSAGAQGLHSPVTSAKQITDLQTVYLMASWCIETGKHVVTGLLKVGPKDLYLFNERGQMCSRNGTPAVLDFYVHSSHQRRGLGKRLFDNMLTDQGLKLCKCAVDRPSPMMISFLAKHYGLVRTIAQGNKYMLFEGFFGNDDVREGSTRRSRNLAQGQLPAEELGADPVVLSMAEIMEAGKRINRGSNNLTTRLYGASRRWP